MKTSFSAFAVSSVLALAAVACSSSQAPDTGEDEGAVEQGDAGKQASASASEKWVGPQPGTQNNPVDKQRVVDAMKKIRNDFYVAKTAYSRPPTSPPDGEPGSCLSACPPWWGDLVCHFYCWYPGYQATDPNIRACFSGTTRGVTRVDPQTNQQRPLFYPEAYDYCVYQNADFVGNSRMPAYDQNVIDQNKAAASSGGSGASAGDGGTSDPMPGGLKWVKQNQDEAFRYVMYSWYDPNFFSYADQQAALNDFYRQSGLQRPQRPTDATATPTGNPSLVKHQNADAVIIPFMKKYAEARR